MGASIQECSISARTVLQHLHLKKFMLRSDICTSVQVSANRMFRLRNAVHFGTSKGYGCQKRL